MNLARVFIFGVPLAAASLTWWSAKQARASRTSRESEIVAMLPGAPPALNPFVPATEVDRQIVDLIHEPLIRIGADGKLKPALAERWDWSQTITCWFLKAEQATKAADKLKAISADKWIEWSLESATADHTALVMRFTEMGRAGPDAVMREIASFEPLPAEIIRIDLNEQARPYHEHFMANAVEAGQMKRVWFDGANSMEIVAAGNAPKFFEEITNYYNAKTNLKPRVQSKAHITALQEPVLEMILQEGRQWHDGSPVTAEDVRATHAYVMSQPWAVPKRDALREVQDIETMGTSRLRIFYRRDLGPALCGWVNLPILPAKWLEQHPADEAGRVFTENLPPGAGIFTVTHRDLSSLALAPALSSWASFHVRRLTFASGASPFQTKLGFATGAADMFWPDNDEIATVLKGKGLAIRGMPPRSRLLVLWNTRAPILADVKVREALSLATNRQALIDELLNGRGRIQEGIFQPGLWFAQKFPTPRFDLDAACKLLESTGWMRDVEGIARRPGKPFAFELLTTIGNPQRLKLAETLAAQWRKLGAQVKITTVPWEELIDQRLMRRQFDAAIIGLDFETTWDQLPFWHSSQATAGGLNFSGIADRQIDLLLEGLRAEFDPDQVPGKAKELEDRLLALQPMLPLFADMSQVAVRITALQKGAPADDLSPWTLRDLVFDHPAPGAQKPAVPMLLPVEVSPSPQDNN
jgi:ABC-type transport system substrate-binding protein